LANTQWKVCPQIGHRAGKVTDKNAEKNAEITRPETVLYEELGGLGCRHPEKSELKS